MHRKSTFYIEDVRKLSIEQLMEMYNFSSAVLETIWEPVLFLDANYIVRNVNKAFVDIFKLEISETINKLLFEIDKGYWNTKEIKKLLDNIKIRNKFVKNHILYHKYHNENKILSISGRKIKIHGQRGEFIILAIEDITKTKKNEEMLEESKEQFELALETYPATFLIYDDKRRIHYANAFASKITGLPIEKMIGKTDEDIFDKKIVKQYLPMLKKAYKTKKQQAGEIYTKLKFGEYSAIINFIPVLSNDHIKYMFSVTHDISEIKKLEHKKDEFLKVASHELRTPVTSIKMYAQILERKLTDLNTNNSYILNQMMRQIDNVVNLINDLLDMSRIESGKISLVKDRFDLSLLISKTARDLQQSSENHKITINGKAGIIIKADKVKIEQVVNNLLTNAIKYSPKGGKIIVSFKKTKKNIIVGIEDNGIGIPPAKQELIFDKYYKIDYGKVIGNTSSFGLGLFISKEIIKKHGGKIWAESKKGKGSTFYFTLPL